MLKAWSRFGANACTSIQLMACNQDGRPQRANYTAISRATPWHQFQCNCMVALTAGNVQSVITRSPAAAWWRDGVVVRSRTSDSEVAGSSPTRTAFE